MLGNISNIQSGVKNFVLNHKVLTILALGIAILGIAFRGRIYSWIQEACKTTQRTHQTGTQTLTDRPTQVAINPPTKLSDHLSRSEDESDDFQPSPENLILQNEIIEASKIPPSLSNGNQSRELEIFPFVYIGNFEALRAIDPNKGNNPRGFTKLISLTPMHPMNTSELRNRITPKFVDSMTVTFDSISVNPSPPINSEELSEQITPKSIESIAVQFDDTEETWQYLEEKGLDRLFAMINNARANEQPILIQWMHPHHQTGQSACVALLIAYLFNYCNVTIDQALHFINTKGCNVQLTEGLRNRLHEYYEIFL
jgi:hypothetical protein